MSVRPRIPPVEPPYPEEVQEDFSKLMPPGVPPIRLFRTVARNPRVLRRMRRGGLLDPGSITTRAREIMILRITARCGAEYEWGVHVAFFRRQAGFSDAEVAATVRSGADAWPAPAEAALVRLADALHETATVDDALWATLHEHYDDAQLIELVMLAGLYHAVSFVCNATAVEPEEGAPGFPA